MHRTTTCLFALLLFAALAVSPADAAKLTFDDGRILTGRLGKLSGVADDPEAPTRQPGGVDVRPILLVDDGLRRTYISARRVAQANEAAIGAPHERIRIQQNVATGGLRVGGVGPILQVKPWDEFGRRIFSMRTHDGPLHVVQGITEITPVYTKVEALRGSRSIVWEMRIATSSIPRATLSKLLAGTVDPEKPDDRLKIVRLYIQSERYHDARQELEGVVRDFPDLKELHNEIRALRQMGARTVLKEIEMRSAAGQHDLVLGLLEGFPAEDVAGETLAHVREIQTRYAQQRTAGTGLLERLGAEIEAIEQPVLKQRGMAALGELREELNLNTLGRLAAFEQLVSDADLGPSQKAALAISSWLVGSDHATQNLQVALSLLDVRNLVVRYLREPLKLKREELLEHIRAQEGGTPEQIARLLRRMKPPLASEPTEGDPPGHYRLAVPGIGRETDVPYVVQLPPEYDPHRSYPTIVTLNGAGTSPSHQVDWWAGAADPRGRRMGQAARHGYIVIAPDWQKPNQLKYEYAAREHHAVLATLRDACRRFSVNTDRVFLSGHDIGGDAAWDIALAHPDLWAGAIPIVAVADRYCAHYWENARFVPFYFVAGELDGDKMKRNARELDRYLRRGYDATLVEFLGRGHEHFYDEIQRLFDWMGRRERDFFPREFSTATMRTSDNYFWWLELSGFPPRGTVAPTSWPPPRGTKALRVEGRVTAGGINVRTGTDGVTLWLAPELIDFQKRQAIVVNGHRVNARQPFVTPDLAVLLEDVRSRGDRKHPFWAKVER